MGKRVEVHAIDRIESFRPILNRVVIQVERAPEKQGRIVLPESVRARLKAGGEEAGIGVVIAAGPGQWRNPNRGHDRYEMNARVGERVVYRHKFDAAVLRLRDSRGVDYVVLRDFDVLCALDADVAAEVDSLEVA